MNLDDDYFEKRKQKRMPAVREDGTYARLAATPSGNWIEAEPEVTTLLKLNTRLRTALTESVKHNDEVMVTGTGGSARRGSGRSYS